MPRSSAVVRRANKATAGDIALPVSPTRIVCDKNFSFSVKATCDLCDDERDQLWQMFEENMYELYCSSSFGWNPPEKRKEMFHALSRFIIVRDTPNPESDVVNSVVIAYSMFRFEREYRQDVVFCYELQVSKDYRRFGLGRSLIQSLADVGAEQQMTKLVLTVFKANHAAISFYKSMGFTVDESWLNLFKAEGGEEDKCDYFVWSRRLPERT